MDYILSLSYGKDSLACLGAIEQLGWALMLKWDADSPVTFHADGHTVHDFERRFELEDLSKIPKDKKFRWKMINNIDNPAIK